LSHQESKENSWFRNLVLYFSLLFSSLQLHCFINDCVTNPISCWCSFSLSLSHLFIHSCSTLLSIIIVNNTDDNASKFHRYWTGESYVSIIHHLYFQLNFFFTFSIELKDAFALFDRLGGGVISTKDLAFVMRSIGYQTTPSELEQMIREVDQDGSSFFLIISIDNLLF
jgi:hypothetical protein